VHTAQAEYAVVRILAMAFLIALGVGSMGHDIAMQQPFLQPTPKTKQEAHGIQMYLYSVPLQLTSHSGWGLEYRGADDDDGDFSI
jgi:hypothetical protein